MIRKPGFIGAAISGVGSFARKAVDRATIMKVGDLMLGGTASLARSINSTAYLGTKRATMRRGVEAMHKTKATMAENGLRYTGASPRMRNDIMREAELRGIAAGFGAGGKSVGMSVGGGIMRGGRAVGPGARFAGRSAAGIGGAISGPGRRGSLARGALISGGGLAGLTVGSYRGVASMRMPSPELGSQAGMSFYGPGYYTWAKGPGSGMPANHLATQGLTQSLHRMRHR